MTCGVLLVLVLNDKASASSLVRAPGLHNLRYDVTVISLGGSVQPQFLAEGYLDAKPFLHFDSEKGKAQPQGPWADADLRNKTWDTETIDLTDIGMELRRTLAEIMALQDQQEGLHSFQEMLGCEIQENNLARGFWYFFYDGEPFLSYHLETQRWMVLQSFAQPLALEIKNTWDTDRDKHKEYKHRVQGDICGKLQKYLKSSTSVKSQTVPPAVNITRREVVEGNVMLLCRIFGFYPWKISLTWLQDGGPLAQDSQYHGCIVPHVNGTYQTWVSIKVPQREEQRYSCHVEHSGKNYTYPEAFGEYRPY
ncbi:MHC class I polypeptide-related sequence A-like [Orycteropus afer afer]|uniref:MHC class I polypeptide-related sequence A-like n=1 Tax=Orycteropus afer afer TaxID=1230840 RepID=A0A8B7ANR8_ORYAF|nr:MHC class I polypeptide-related sequence A-like [Orycteropus afer afer]